LDQDDRLYHSGIGSGFSGYELTRPGPYGVFHPTKLPDEEREILPWYGYDRVVGWVLVQHQSVQEAKVSSCT